MLQQTQLGRVVERWPRFMARFPTPQRLAQGSEVTALAAWEGLGYYRRVRMLRAAAMKIVQEHSGSTPTSRASLESLPGVGRYTAGAVASIVSGEREPIVDANVARVFLRIGGIAKSATDSGALRWCWDEATRLAQCSLKPGVSNEALMELGGTICTPRAPSCEACPLRKMCRARREGTADTIPLPKRQSIRSRVYMSVVLSRDSRGVLLEQRAATGLWSSMWQPPTVESAKSMARASVARSLGLERDELHATSRFDFQTTHRTVEFRIFESSRLPSKFPAPSDGVTRKFILWKDAQRVAVSSPLRALLSSLAPSKPSGRVLRRTR